MTAQYESPPPLLASLQRWEPLRGQAVLLAYSGGLDSSVLLDLLTRLYRMGQLKRLRICHINHGLNPNAAAWEAHCALICQQLQLPLTTISITVDRTTGLGLEGAARAARYEALSALQTPSEILVTAHHEDDQVETFFLALKRGSGPRGLGSITAHRPFGKGALHRPLLDVPRKALLAYANAANLIWIQDNSNQASRFDRNFLRHTILPPCIDRWPHFQRSVIQAATLCREQETLLDELLKAELDNLQNSMGGLAIELLRKCSPPKRRALLRRWYAHQVGSFSDAQLLETIWYEVAHSKGDRDPKLRLQTHEIRRFQGFLYTIPATQLQPAPVVWDGLTPLVLPHHLGTLTPDWLQGPLRRPQPQETIQIGFVALAELSYFQLTRHARKRYYQRVSLPTWLRGQLPVLFYNETPIFIPESGWIHSTGVAVSETEGWNISWTHPFLRKKRQWWTQPT